jgi:hypothetical protein
VIEAYIQTEYTVPSLNLSIRIGEKHPALDKIMEKYGVLRWAFITAWNPNSQKQPLAFNKRANKDLEYKLKELEYPYWPAKGVALDGSWYEDSFLVLTIKKNYALELARIYRQNAIVYGRYRVEAKLLLVGSSDD